MNEKEVYSAIGNLPSELTSFVGRRRELTDIRHELEVARLVTLTGIGGVGKTRLALRAAAAARRAFRESVRMVEFGEVTDPAMLTETVAAALGLLDRTNRPASELVQEYLAPRHLLVIFDNCEHVLDASAQLAETLLKSSPELKILATSREPLNIDGESVIRVPPLAIPAIPGDRGGNREAVGDAVTLFAERARSHSPGFELTADNIDTILQICQRLDGLPLPIELAAARIRTLSVTQILDHLTDRYRLLTAGRRGAPSRQQTLRASVDWSRDLCNADEQRLWARLSVFAGGAQLDAIERVCADPLAEADVLDLVGSLVDKSIVISDEPDTEVRYRMLETLREYGQADLTSSGEYAEVRRRHSEWYLDLATRAADEWVHVNRASWAGRLAREQANLREAMEYCFDQPGDIDTGLLIAVSLYPYWLTCGRFSEGRRWLNRAWQAEGASQPLRARALLLDSVLAGLQGDTAAACRLLTFARTIADPSDTTPALAHYASGYVALYQGESEEAATQLTASARMFQSSGDIFMEWGSLEGLGLAQLVGGRMEDAARTLNDALAITAIGGEYPDLHAYPLWALAIALWQQGDTYQATAALRRGLQISRRGDPLALAYSLQISGWIAADSGLEQRAAVLLGAADTLWRNLGSTILIFPEMANFQDRCDEQLRTKLGATQIEVARNRGAAMNREEVAAFALDEPPPEQAGPDGDTFKLTKRERQVSALVAEGMTNKAIAESLVISQRTAQGHVENILSKLGFTSRAQIAAWITHQRPAANEANV